ncbi:unnamed protein product [Rotaria sp. Silwood1]|nr:unnamed protein product [Rotaria sp. Silwood1]
MIDGRSITDYNIKQFREKVGVVSQEPILFGMSIYENIRLGKVNATRTEIEQAAQEANAHHFIMQLPDKYETLVGECGIQLSGGEKQRIALARALVKQPTFLLLDEATSALDNVSEKLVQEALDRACKGRTTIVIAHRLTTIQNAHQIYVLNNGTVIEQGTHETLMTKDGGKYQSMVKRQQMEKIDDDEDGMMNMQKATEEDEKLLSMNSPEWITILIGCIACALSGAAQPMFALLLAKIIDYTAFAISGSKLTQRIRAKAFACLLRQEVAYFDQPENSSGAICTRLSTDASAVQEMTGTRVDFRGEIKFDQVKFIYATRPTSVVLDKFQLNIKPSQRVALVGASGCGKSTIIQLLERFYDVTSGQLLLDGIDIRKLNLHWVRSHFGLVSQEPILFDLTIAENIAYGLENIPMNDIINAARKANIHQFVEQLPQIVQEALEQAQTEDPSRTSLIIAHRLSTVRACDLICVFNRGHIVESGTHKELIQRREAYYKMLAQHNLK